MNGTLYRLEARRLLRTHTLLALVLVFGIFGAVGPLLSYFMEDFLTLADPRGELAAMDFQLPEMTAVDALGSYVELAAPVGTLVVILVATMALTVDSGPGRAVFYRTRVSGAAEMLLPRFVLPAAAAVLAHLAGSLVAWALASALFEPLSPSVLIGALIGGVFPILAVAVVALMSSLMRNALAVVGASALALMLLSGIGQIPALAEWVPSTLMRGPALLAAGASVGDLLPAAAVGLVGTALLLFVTVNRSGAREI
ncbi:ABC transporter [Nocardiopsis alba]|uniref:ABC transporter n=1 Tax=Nocardiopsis alba TaxID=53437 RepID=A0ABV5E114_9ACTN